MDEATGNKPDCVARKQRGPANNREADSRAPANKPVHKPEPAPAVDCTNAHTSGNNPHCSPAPKRRLATTFAFRTCASPCICDTPNPTHPVKVGVR